MPNWVPSEGLRKTKYHPTHRNPRSGFWNTPACVSQRHPTITQSPKYKILAYAAADEVTIFRIQCIPLSLPSPRRSTAFISCRSRRSRGRSALVRVRTSIRLQVLCHKDFIAVAAVLLEGVLFESIFHEAQTLI